VIDVYCTGCLKPISSHAFTFGRCHDGNTHCTLLADSEYVRELRVAEARRRAPSEDGDPHRSETET
jgi:hypothetical protein